MDRVAKADIAVIVPVLENIDALANLSAMIEKQTLKPREVIVVTGRPNTHIEDFCDAHAYSLIEAQPNRGAQKDIGAKNSTATVFWFVHADAAFGDHALAEIEQAVVRGARAGCFRFQFSGRRTCLKDLIERLVALRIRVGGMVYGDQAIFATRQAYFDAGGFTHDPLFDEVKLVKALRRTGAFEVLEAPVFVATQRWDRDGWIRRSLHNRWLAARFALGTPAKALDSAYRKPRPQRREAGS